MPEPRVTVTQLIKQQEKNKLLEQEIEIKRAKVAAFQGLPPVSQGPTGGCAH
jgi:hypothetical protein